MAKIMHTKKSPPGLSPADHRKPIVIDTPDDLFKLGVNVIVTASLCMGGICPIKHCRRCFF